MALVEKNKTGDVLSSEFSDLYETEIFYSPNKKEEVENENTVPSVNIRENTTEFKIELAAPGFSKNDFIVNVEDNILTISAENKENNSEENEPYTKKEFSYSSFYRSFMLPQSINSKTVDATYADGILKLCIPKKEESEIFPIKVD